MCQFAEIIDCDPNPESDECVPYWIQAISVTNKNVVTTGTLKIDSYDISDQKYNTPIILSFV